MPGLLSFEMIRAGADVLRDHGVPQHVADKLFDAIHLASGTDQIAGKPSRGNPYIAKPLAERATRGNGE